MVIQVEEYRRKPRNYFITTEEAKILWKHAGLLGSRFQIMMGFALFRGMRIGEICATNLYDFSKDFQQMRVVVEKSHIADNFPVLTEFSEQVKEFVSMNMQTFKDGYLFPATHTNKRKCMSIGVAILFFNRLRKRLIDAGHTSFAEHYFEYARSCKACKNRTSMKYQTTIGAALPVGTCRNCGFVTTKPNRVKRYRVSWHSARRWFECAIYDQYKDPKMVADIMRYLKPSTVYTYLDPYKHWKNENKIMEETFGGIFKDFNDFSKGQTKIGSFN